MANGGGLDVTVIAFYWEADACDPPPPTIFVDAVVDSFFLLDIILNFW